MHTVPQGFSFHVICPLLNKLLGFATVSEHTGANLPDRLRLATALEAYAYAGSPPDPGFVPLPDSRQLVYEWLNAAAAKRNMRLAYIPLAHFAGYYPARARMVRLGSQWDDPALIAARA